MPTSICPRCAAPIAAGDINIAEGVALCRACGQLSRLAEVVAEPDPGVLADPPRGCRVDDLGHEIIVSASLRSLKGAIAALGVSLFWNGIVSVFVLVAIAGLYTHFIGPLPSWFPVAPSSGGSGGSGGSGNMGPNMPLGMTIFLCIFLIPFVVIGLVMIGAFITSLGGGVTVRIRGAEGSVRTGWGPVGWTRRFDAAAVRLVTCVPSTQDEEAGRQQIKIDADRPIRFGSTLSEERRAWMLAVLRTLLVAHRGRRG